MQKLTKGAPRVIKKTYKVYPILYTFKGKKMDSTLGFTKHPQTLLSEFLDCNRLLTSVGRFIY